LNLRSVRALKKKLKNFKKKSESNSFRVVISFGYGSAIPFLRKLYDQIFYFDLTREELFNQSERHPIFFLGSKGQGPAVHEFLRRFYYIDSQVLNKQKRYVLRYMNWYVECNFSREPKLISKDIYYQILSSVAQRPFRIKPLYYPVAWGGNWLKKLKNLPPAMPNSGQGCIVASENSIRIRVNNLLILEIPFINLLWKESLKILGSHVSKKFHGEFPFTYWYDDGIEGGNMAIQVHPNNSYIREQFNEPIRQDESYYILHTGPGAVTYLGLKEDVDLRRFFKEAERAEKKGVPLEYERYVNSIPTKPGDYFLIPAGTVHASGRNQVVLEIDGGIAAYSPGYTFHIYDYLRPDLDGKLRPIHLKHAFNVIKEYRRANWVLTNLKQTPRLIRSGDDWAEYLLGQRNDMYYAVYRLEFKTQIEDDTKGGLILLSLVEGDSVIVQSESDPEKRYVLKFPDTLTVPACVGKFLIISPKGEPCKVVKALIK
jgi:mannose-6-phosphate isomerase class I